MILNTRIVISIASGLIDEWDEQLLIKSLSMAMGSRRLILRSLILALTHSAKIL